MARIVPDDAVLIPDHATRVFEGVIFDVYQWPQELFDGSVKTFERLKRPDTVLFIAIRDDKLLFIVDQQPHQPTHTRLPGGRVDAGEAWLAAVQRECKEELGLQFANWKLVDVCQPVTKVEWFVATYIATGFVSEQAPKLDAGEKIRLKPMSFDDAKQYMLSTSDSLNMYTRALFEHVNSLKELQELPEFCGREVK
jgi:ADP-ribose pyrophosphatase